MKDLKNIGDIWTKSLVDATNMLKMLFSLFTGLSHELAYETIQMDDKVDKWDKKMEKRLAEAFKDKVLSRQAILNIMYITSISYNIERVVDMAVNMAEAAIYLVEGRMYGIIIWKKKCRLCNLKKIGNVF